MGYTPYKMVGHTLKGIKQNPAAVKLKAFGTNDSDMPDGISTTPGKYAGGVGGSPAKGLWDKIKKGAKKFAKGEGALGLLNPVGRGISEIQKAKEKKAQAAEQSAAATAGAAGGGGGDLEGRVAALESGGGNAGGGGKPLAAQMLAGAGGAKTGMFGGMMPGGMGGGMPGGGMLAGPAMVGSDAMMEMIKAKGAKKKGEGWGGAGEATGLPIV